MIGLSLSRQRFAGAVALAFMWGLAEPALGQVPVYVAPEPPEPEPPEPEPPEPEPLPEAPPLPLAPPAPPPAAQPQVAPAPPPAASASAGAAPPALAPARTDHIEQPGAGDEEDEAEEPYYVSPPERRWYGWQTLTADGSSFALVLLSASLSTRGNESAEGALLLSGALGYWLAPGIIHLAHGHVGRGFGSVGMRFGMPMAGAFVGLAAASGCRGFLCETNGAAIGTLIGMAGAIAIDAAVFAYDDPKPFDPIEARRLVPVATFGPRHAWLGLQGEL
jgi:hypothetical protein